MTETQHLRRSCWLILVCLSMPEWHPARTRRLPEIATDLAIYSAQHRISPLN